MPRPSRTVLPLFLAVLVVASSFAGAEPAESQTEAPDATVDTRPVIDDGSSPVNNILPRPNSGQAPDSPNDPGGWQQYLVFGLILAGLVVIVLLVLRESRRARAVPPS
jgi:hypothetical protein